MICGHTCMSALPISGSVREGVSLLPLTKRNLTNTLCSRGLVKDLSAVRPGDVTLDIGCGTGLSTVYAASIAKKVVGVDPSPDMTRKLTKKIQRRNIKNIEIKNGYFPEALAHGEKFDSIISSFMLAHFGPKQRAQLIVEIYNRLNGGGRLGLFSAQGEVAPTFERRKETVNNLSLAGFQDIEVRDVSDVYRISAARKQ